MTGTMKTLAMTAVVMAGVLGGATGAQAHGRGGIDIGIGGLFTAPATERVLVSPGHYELRTETVLVEKGHWEKQCIPAVQQVVVDRHGRTQVVTVEKERKVKVWVPDRFETRTVRVWVAPVYQTRVVGPACGVAPVINIGGRIRW